MPLTIASVGEVASIIWIGDKEEIKRYLESMGFVSGTYITVISVNSGDVVVGIKRSRVTISREMANKTIV